VVLVVSTFCKWEKYMANSSFPKAWAEMVFVGPMLSWRMLKMAVASARVIRRRSSLIISGPKSAQERKEYRKMIQEKFQGLGEASTAYFASFKQSLPVAFALSSRGVTAINAWNALFAARTPISFFRNYVRLGAALGWLFIAIFLEECVFLPRLFLNTTQPLSKRVSANAARLSRGSQRVRAA
jgi:hypothetical protein